MDLETVSAGDFGRSLKGIGLNLLVRDVHRQVAFLRDIFDMTAFQVSTDFAILTYEANILQIHSDSTYHSNPLLSLLPEVGPRGGGMEIRLYETDPDKAVAKARAHEQDLTILQEATDKPHGLREAYILCENGYAFVPSRALKGL